MESILSDFLAGELTLNQMTVGERDAVCEGLHQLDNPAPKINGLQVVFRYDDVRQVLMGDLGEDSNKNSLDPLVGYPRIMRTPSTIWPFLRGLIPLPARATANAPNDQQHRDVHNILTRHFTISPNDAAARIDDMRGQFDEVWQELGYNEKTKPIDIARLSVGCAALITGVEVGLSKDDWEWVAKASEAQSGLLGQYYPESRELGVAVKGLSDLFILCRRAVKGKTKDPIGLVKELTDKGIPKPVVKSALANSLAAGVYTMGGTGANAVARIMSNSNQVLWQGLGNFEQAVDIGLRTLQIDPGLAGWKRYAPEATKLDSGTYIEKGPVLALIGAANRDPAVFPNATDLESEGLKKPLTFGMGPHMCPGRSLARLAIPVFLHELYKRVPEVMPVRGLSERENPRDLIFSISHPLIVRR